MKIVNRIKYFSIFIDIYRKKINKISDYHYL